MSADLHLVVAPEHMSAEELEYVLMFDYDNYPEDSQLWAALEKHSLLSEKLYSDSGNMDDVWVGQVSWLKAGLDDDVNRYVPSVVSHIVEEFTKTGGTAVLTAGLVDELVAGFDLPSSSVYEQTPPAGEEDNWFRGVASKQDVRDWLHSHLGSRVFATSW